jgi:hypothetical protein
MMAMKKTKILMLLFALSGFNAAIAQSDPSVIIEGAQVFSGFRFVDAQGNKDNTFAHRAGGAFCLGYQYIWDQGVALGVDFGIYNAGATKMVSKADYKWNLQYERVKIDFGYVVPDKWEVKPFVMVSPYYGYLLKASQTTGSADYDLKKGGNFSVSDWGFVATGGARAQLSHRLQAFAAYNENVGLANIETTPGQKLNNRGFYVSLGLVIDIRSNLQYIKDNKLENQK